MPRSRIPQTAEEWVDFLLELDWQPCEAIDDRIVVTTHDGKVCFTPAFLQRIHLLDEEYADTNFDPTELFGEIFSALLEGNSIEAMLSVLRQFDMDSAAYGKPPVNDPSGFTIVEES